MSGQFGAVFAAAFAVQRLIELFDTYWPVDPKAKKQATAWAGTIAGLLLVGIARGVLGSKAISILPDASGILDTIVTGLAIGAGTDGVNSILKYVSYSKDNQNPTLQIAGTPAAPSSTAEARRLAAT